MKSFKRSKFWIKLRHWEYWPWQIVYAPIFAYWLWCGLKVRAIFYISAANPGFEHGGIVSASKTAILDMIPAELVPHGILVNSSVGADEIVRKMEAENLRFPVVIKPDIGERGFNVELIRAVDELKEYLPLYAEQLIVQEYIDLPLEAGIFYYRMPDEDKGTVTSVVIKGLMSVKGDGVSSIRELMQRNERASLQIKRLTGLSSFDLSVVPKKDEVLLLEPIGNHVRGTAFLNGNHLINQKLIDVIDTISKNIEGFYYGRYDLRCQDEEDLYTGNFKIMELNGSASEPAHIYAPGYPLLKAYKDLFAHWKILYKISKMNHQNGVPYMSFQTGIAALRKSRFAKKN